DGAGAGDIVGDVMAMDQLHRWWRELAAANAHLSQDEWKAAAVGRAAHQAEATVGRVARKQRDVDFGQAVDRARVLRDDFDAHAFRRTRECRKGEEQAAAIGTESLGFDGPPGQALRANVGVGDVFVALRDSAQYRRVVAKVRLDIPAGD